MKRILTVILIGGVGFAIGAVLVSSRLNNRHARQQTELQAAWQAEKTELEADLKAARAHAQGIAAPVIPAPAAGLASPTKLSPSEIVAKLVALKSAPPNQTRTGRQAIYWLEELIAAGPAALPAIRQFLDRNEDFDFAALNQSRGGRAGGAPGDFMFPPSLRFGLFDAVKQIGGVEAEALLANVLTVTGRGVEVAWLARTLQEVAPNKYREVALGAARELLARPLVANPSSPLDRNERDQLFNILTMYGDSSYTAAAQAQLLRADGEVDRSALRYLQQTLGQQSVLVAAQFYDDPRITDPAKKEPFARLALNYVGADAQANEFYQKAINDMALSRDHRRNLIEDLNQDGFPDTRNLTTRDLPLIQNRILLIEQLAPGATDPVNIAAFKEAYKDLVNMRERIVRPPRPAQ